MTDLIHNLSISSTSSLTFSPAERLVLITLTPATRPIVLNLAARLIYHGPLRVLDGGNQFNVYHVAHVLRQLIQKYAVGPTGADLEGALARTLVSRAFTCYQMAALLCALPDEQYPSLVLDLLATFYDENVSLPESLRLLAGCIQQFQRLSRTAPVIIAALKPGPLSQDRLPLYDRLKRSVSAHWDTSAQ